MSDDVNIGSAYWQRVRILALNRDGWKCKKCGTKLTSGTRTSPGNAHVDHIIPRVRGGKTEMSNLQSLCSVCHKEKSDAETRAAWGKPTTETTKPEQLCRYHGSRCEGQHSEVGAQIYDIMFGPEK